MAEIINFRRARKGKMRRSKDEKAAANRVQFGTPKAEKTRVKMLHEKDTAMIDSHELDGGHDGGHD